MKFSAIIIAANLLLAAGSAFAQEAEQPDSAVTAEAVETPVAEAVQPETPTSDPISASAATGVSETASRQLVARLLPASTPLEIASDGEISSKKIEVDDKFTFSVVADVLEYGEVVVPRGSKVTATVSWKTGRAIGGKSGKFELTFTSINVRGVDYAMSGTHRQEGKGNTVAAVFATWLVSGRSAVMTPGQTVTALTGEPIPY